MPILTQAQVIALVNEQSSKGLSSLTKEQVKSVLGLKSAQVVPDMIIHKPLGYKKDIIL